jgi:hypothetical protein
MIKDDIQAWIKEQREIIPRLNAMDKTLKKLTKAIERHIERAWKKCKQNGDIDPLTLQGGSHTKNFKFDVKEHAVSIRGKKEQWFRKTYTDDYELEYEQTEAPTSVLFVRNFAKRMSDELGIEIYESIEFVPSKSELSKHHKKYGFQDFAGLNARYDFNLELVCKGEVAYKGWDITDPFIVARQKFNGKLVIAYAVNSHGIGIDNVLDDPSDKEIEEFLSHVEQDNDNLGVRGKINV